MKKIILTITLSCQLLTISACSTTAPNKFTPLNAEEGQSIVYVYRASTMSNAMYSPDIVINDEVKFDIENSSKYLIKLEPGEYKIEVDPNKNYSGTTSLTLDLKAGKNTYLRVDTKLKIQKSARYKPYVRSFSLVKTDEATAIEEIAACCNANNIKESSTEKIPSTKKKKDGFSVDKTQNPFSH